MAAKNPTSTASTEATPSGISPSSTSKVALTPGTNCYKIGVFHIDNANAVVVLEIIPGIINAEGNFVDTSHLQLSLPLDKFATALGADGQALLTAWNKAVTDISAIIATLSPVLKGLPVFGA